MERSRIVGAVMAVGLVAAACGGATTPSAAPATQAAASAAATQAAGQLPKPELTKIRIGISAPSEPVQFAEKLAQMLGIYQRNGITDVTVTGFEGDGKALQALVAGQLDLFVGGGSTAVNSVLTDTPLKIVSVNGLILNDALFCTKDIKAAADVKGKSVAVSTFGGTSHGSVLLSLKALSLTPKDVTITQVGGESTRIAALKGGSIGCAPIDAAKADDMKALGFNLLVDLTKSKLSWARSGLMAKAEFITKNPNTVLVVVASALEAHDLMWSDPKTASAKFAEFAQIKPADAEKEVTKVFTPIGNRPMTFTEEALIAPRDVLAAVNPAVANVDVKKAMDTTFIDKLKQIGFYKAHGIPEN